MLGCPGALLRLPGTVISSFGNPSLPPHFSFFFFFLPSFLQLP